MAASYESSTSTGSACLRKNSCFAKLVNASLCVVSNLIRCGRDVHSEPGWLNRMSSKGGMPCSLLVSIGRSHSSGRLGAAAEPHYNPSCVAGCQRRRLQGAFGGHRAAYGVMAFGVMAIGLVAS